MAKTRCILSPKSTSMPVDFSQEAGAEREFEETKGGKRPHPQVFLMHSEE